MDNTLTISSRSFVRTQDPVGGGSKRINTTDGVNLPEVMIVRHMDAKDSATKAAVRRSQLRMEKHCDGGDGTVPVIAATLVVQVPKHSSITATQVLDLVERMAKVISKTADNGLQLADEIFVDTQV